MKVKALQLDVALHGSPFAFESRTLGIVRKMGGKFLPNLNMTWRPIAEKYCEGKLKRIVKTKLKVPEIVSREQFGGCEYGWRAVYCALPDKGEEDMRKRAGNGGTKLCSDTTRFLTAWPLPGRSGF